ncbi:MULTISPECIES: DUF4369 domain-containing protein [Flavobacteriaceae]|uniref:DUF4369 domain-containing protein n=2 Tax=Flavobacteriaceae TaxID=49546 RepID=A0A4Y8AQW3_9FLAO|nr:MULTISPECIES: DUF4369 domain-containing protein [Flavobacteriaceae]TEW73142.1 DUF4369 domain-containing protein [Gramella jeungdoensis]GGK46697.1 hypothetical protein GCM10007963_13720 [Lutibacter litoralis]
MKKIVFCFVLVSLLISCSKEKTGSMVVNGNIDGLKKGTVYLEKIVDTVLVAVDSVEINGLSSFVLVDDLKTPEMYYLTLDKKETEKIPFFGEKGTLTITSKLEKLLFSAKITGSKNQELLDEYKSMIQQFRGKELDFIKDKFEAQRNEDETLLLKLEAEEKNLIKRKYYYTTNFALQHKDKEVAPYIALTELYNANFKLLDTINKSLTKEIKISKYGMELDKFITEIKKND